METLKPNDISIEEWLTKLSSGEKTPFQYAQETCRRVVMPVSPPVIFLEVTLPGSGISAGFNPDLAGEEQRALEMLGRIVEYSLHPYLKPHK
jgi:hypothetical protein